MAQLPLNRPIPAPRRGVKEVTHINRPIPAPRQSVKSVKTDIHSIHENQGKQEMDQVSMGQKTQKERSVKVDTHNSSDNKSKQMMDQASIEHKT